VQYAVANISRAGDRNLGLSVRLGEESTDPQRDMNEGKQS
jgi:hypothetical protein